MKKVSFAKISELELSPSHWLVVRTNNVTQTLNQIDPEIYYIEPNYFTAIKGKREIKYYKALQ